MASLISLELILAIVSFALVTSATPGPNNIMLTASGANFGLVRSLPHIAGIIAGVALLNLSVGLGLGALFQQFPLMQQLLKLAGSAYLIWLAYKLLQFSTLEGKDNAASKPFSFFQAAAFQTINPKAWVIVISANASFSLAGANYWPSVGIIILVFALVGLPSITIWTAFGQLISRYLDDFFYLKIFNWVMAVLTASCVIFIWWD